MTILFIIIGLNIIISIYGFNNIDFFNNYKFQINKIIGGEKIRMLSSGFLHADFMHLGFNLYALYMFGKIVLQMFGSNFLLIYFVSLLGGNLYSLYVHQKEPYYSAIGASGAVSGIIFSSILLFPEMKIGLILIPIRIPASVFGIGYLLYSIYGMKKSLGNIGHSAHLGGAIAGFFTTLLLAPRIITNHPIIVCSMGAIILGLFFFGDKIKF